MKNNRLRDAIRAGGRTLGTRMSTTWPFFIELVGNSGNFDYVEYVLALRLFVPPEPDGEEFSHIFNYNRSEEHTSELQSRTYLVCRLLLEKKKSSA